MAGKIEAIVFDFDGVIHDTFELVYSIHKKFRPESSREDYRSYFDGNLFKTAGRNKEGYEKFKEIEFELFKELKLEKNIRKVLEKLSKKYDLYIISSNSIKNLNLYFENNNFTNVFKEILAAETHKSKTEKFKILFKKYHLTPESCLFVTDTLGDILEANEVGVKSIACTFGFHERKRLEKGNPYKIVSSFDGVLKTIEEMDLKVNFFKNKK